MTAGVQGFSPDCDDESLTARTNLRAGVMICDTWLRGSVAVTKPFLLCHLPPELESTAGNIISSLLSIMKINSQTTVSSCGENLRSRLSEHGNVERFVDLTEILTCST